MKRLICAVTALSLILMAGSAMAQRPSDRDGTRRGDRDGDRQRESRDGDRRGGFDRGRFGPPPNPLVTALDVDKNGEISADELKNAVAALKTLDKNKDGKLTREELRPEGFGGGAAGRGRGRGSSGGTGGGDFLSRLMSRDANGDGKLSGDEIPSFMAERLQQMDTNGDKAIDKKELEAASQRFGRRSGGGDRRPGGRTGGGDRPQRPQRPNGDS